MTVEWKGAPGLDAAKRRGLQLAGDALLDDAKARTPVESGALRDSGTATVDGDESVVGFGTEYAVRQHFRENFRHDDGEAFYLQNAVQEFGPQFEQILAEAIGREIGG